MRFCRVILLVLLTSLSLGHLRCQGVSTMGTDFWLSFMRGRIEASMSVTITGNNACTGTISNQSGWSQNFSVPANGSVTISIDTAKSYNTVSNTIKNKGLHIVTTDTVSVYASNFLSSSFDVTYVLPTPVLRDEYMVQTFETWKSGFQSEVLIVATEDSTTVDIYPTAPTINATTSSNYSVTLNTGQCYLMQCSGYNDYSGTRIRAQDCKRIAVFNGHHCAHIPVTTGTYCDHLFEQAIPVAYWGKHFVATMSSHHNGEYIKVTALKDSCSVTVGTAYATTLDAGESYSFTMTNNQHSKYIETSQPATVYAYMMSKNVAGPHGDPSMILVPPIEQQLHDVVFVNYDNPSQLSQYHHINIVARSQDIGQIYLDGSSIGNFFANVTGNNNYSFARISTTTGSHRLYATGGEGFVAHAYGVGENESYGYAVGFSAKALNRQLFVNDEEVTPGDTIELCFGDTVVAYLKSEDSLYVLGWYKEEAPFTIDDTLIINCALSGISCYEAVYSTSNNCFSNYDTISFYVLGHESSESQFDTVACQNGVNWGGAVYDSAGTYMHVFSNQYGCDSTVIMHLEINNERYAYLSYSGCDSVVLNGTAYYSNDTVVKETLTTAEGCDSIVMAYININHSYSNTFDAVIFYGDTLHWIDGNAYYDEDDHPTYIYHSVDGCDSIVTLNLSIIYPEIPETPPMLDSSALWVPNAFTPDENKNNRFCIFGNDLIEAHVYIFDRRGDYVTDFDGLTQSWDGTSRGRSCKAESYVYLIEYKIKTMPRVMEKKMGTVMLIR